MINAIKSYLWSFRSHLQVDGKKRGYPMTSRNVVDKKPSWYTFSYTDTLNVNVSI